MKINILGVKIVSGLTKEAQRPFEIPRVLCMTPIETGKFGSVEIRGYGFEVAEMELAPEALELFASIKFPIQAELTTEQKFHRGKFETIVIGLVGQPVLKAASNG